MIPSAVPSRVLVAFVLLSTSLAPAIASQPALLAGKMIPNASGSSCQGFRWDQSFYPYEIGSAETVTIDMAIVPFATGTTVFTLGQGSDEESFRLVNVVFANGLVNGVPYNWNKWNDVTIQLSPLTRNYVLTVNGVQGGPFPFADPCGPIYGCSSTLVWHELRGSVTDDNDVGWIDTFRISADSPVLMIENTFDSYCGGAVFDGIGGLVTARPPVKFGH